MLILFVLYLYFGALGFLYEISHNNHWVFALTVAICYPITMFLGLIGWMIVITYHLSKAIHHCALEVFRNIVSK
jgi:hypothetical protein